MDRWARYLSAILLAAALAPLGTGTAANAGVRADPCVTSATAFDGDWHNLENMSWVKEMVISPNCGYYGHVAHVFVGCQANGLSACDAGTYDIHPVAGVDESMLQFTYSGQSWVITFSGVWNGQPPLVAHLQILTSGSTVVQSHDERFQQLQDIDWPTSSATE